MRRRALRAVLLAALASAPGCAGTPEADPRYRPAQSILEVVAVLQRHVGDDTYRFEPARDFTGRNVYRASLLRLENLERVHAQTLRAGTHDDVIAFAKGRALERLRAYDLAAVSYRRTAERDGPLRLEALRSAALCDALAEAVALTAGDAAAPDDATAAEEEPATAPLELPHVAAPAEPASLPLATDRLDPDASLAAFEARAALLEAMLPDVRGTHYEAVVREEIERVDVARARWLADVRRLTPDGDVRALGEIQRLVTKHRESKNTNAHLLMLADLYAELSVEYVETHPPESLRFDPPRFEELVEAAARLYEAIANQDGAPEKLEAARRLEALLAFTLKVDRDRFTP